MTPARSIRRVASGLGWPEGPSPLPDGSIVFVETYRSRLSVLRPDDTLTAAAVVGGGPNATAVASDGSIYVTQNSGIVGPWKATARCPGSIQRVDAEGGVEVVATHVDGVALRAPNDLAFGDDGVLYFTDPGGSYDPFARSERGRIFALSPDGTGELLEELDAVYPNGVAAADGDRSIVWTESYTRSVKRRTQDSAVTELTILPEGHVPDGLAIAEDGCLFVATTSSSGIDIVEPGGGLVGFIPVGTVPTNCTFRDSTLFVTDGGHKGMSETAACTGALWAIELDTRGQLGVRFTT